MRDLAGGREDDVEAAVHDARKRCKKLRGLLRLVRPVIGAHYKPANRAFRDAARELGPYRDAHAVLETFDELTRNAPGRDAATEPLTTVGAGLADDAERASSALRDDKTDVERATHFIEVGIDRARRSRIDVETGRSDGCAVLPGIRKTYKRGRKAMERAAETGAPDDFHEWRKRCKYSWYHLRLVRDAAPWILRPLADGFHALSNTLGDAHDLHVLTGVLNNDPDRYGGEEGIDRVATLASSERCRLERAALRGGVILFAEKPTRFVDRLDRY